MKNRTYLLSALLLLAGYLATGFYQVKAGEQAVVRRFGKVLDEPRLPGLNFGLPWGFDQVDIVSVEQQRQLVVGFPVESPKEEDVNPLGQFLTADNNLVDIRVVIHYRVDPSRPDAVVDYVLNADRIEPLLSRAAEVALTNTLAAHLGNQVLGGRMYAADASFDEGGTARYDLPLQVQSRLEAALRPYPLGIAIDSVNIAYVGPPAKLQDVFRQVNQAYTQMETARKEAEKEAKTQVSAAAEDYTRVTSEADRSYLDQVSAARAKQASFMGLLPDYRKNPEEAWRSLLREGMKKVFAGFQLRYAGDTGVELIFTQPGGER